MSNRLEDAVNSRTSVQIICPVSLASIKQETSVDIFSLPSQQLRSGNKPLEGNSDQDPGGSDKKVLQNARERSRWTGTV